MADPFTAAQLLNAGSNVLGGAAGKSSSSSARNGDIYTPISTSTPFDSSGWNVNVHGLGLQAGGSTSWLLWGAIALLAWKTFK